MYFKLKEEVIDSYPNITDKFVKFPGTLNKINICNKTNTYYYWRLRKGHNDEMVCTKIKLSDLELIKK